MKIIKIISPKHGNFDVMVDDEDYEHLASFHWCIHKSKTCFYAMRNEWSKNKAKKIFMHRYLLGMPTKYVDHIDGNTINNQRCNLRLASSSESQQNRRKQTNNTTGFKGVHFYKAYKKYSVHIGHNHKNIFGGYFDNPIDAAKRYNELALKYHGDFASLNQIN